MSSSTHWVRSKSVSILGTFAGKFQMKKPKMWQDAFLCLIFPSFFFSLICHWKQAKNIHVWPREEKFNHQCDLIAWVRLYRSIDTKNDDSWHDKIILSKKNEQNKSVQLNRAKWILDSMPKCCHIISVIVLKTLCHCRRLNLNDKWQRTP